jgi:hypothetical protein
VTVSNDSTVGLVAGAAIIGKVGIDQTTPGTTNGVQINAALPTGTNSIGVVNPDQIVTGGAGALGALNNAVTVTSTVGPWSDVNIQLASGTSPSLTVTFESSVDGTTYNARVCRQTDLTGALSTTTTTFPSEWRCNGAGMNNFRVRVSSYTSGSTTANMRASEGVGPVFLNAPLPTGSNIIGIVTTDQTAHGTTDLVAADVTKVSGSAISLGSKTSANSFPVVIASDQGAVPVSSSTLALDATLTGGTAKGIVRGGQKGSTNTNADITHTPSGANHELIDMAIYDAAGNQITTFGGGTQYADGTVQATPTGTVAMGKDPSNVLKSLPLRCFRAVDYQLRYWLQRFERWTARHSVICPNANLSLMLVAPNRV